MKTKNFWIIAVALVLSFGINALLIGNALQRFKMDDRFVSVKGLSEREVKADLVVWNIQTRIVNDNLLEGSDKIEEAKNKIVEFLIQKQISKDDIITEGSSVIDKRANQYENYQQMNTPRYLITQIIQIRSSNVDLVQNVSRMTGELLQAGVVISNNEYGNPIQYYFTKLNDIKPEMISEATQKAREAALKFATENDSKLGRLKKANQGLFTIVDRTASLSGGEGGYASSTVDIYKKVRVVISAEYSIK
ncbi:MAG: hypothetical protein A2066_21360 [Bacteroidetes bacterium GWB2_41_8]|nr:MAG: hypothetical protein A2066_21360 [Bacteroidetes bacterium GWB2_41_8]